MSFFVDCPVAARWLLPDEASAYTDAVFERLNGEDAVVPALFVSELANVFLKLSRRRLLSPEVAAEAVQKVCRPRSGSRPQSARVGSAFPPRRAIRPLHVRRHLPGTRPAPRPAARVLGRRAASGGGEGRLVFGGELTLPRNT